MHTLCIPVYTSPLNIVISESVSEDVHQLTIAIFFRDSRQTALQAFRCRVGGATLSNRYFRVVMRFKLNFTGKVIQVHSSFGGHLGVGAHEEPGEAADEPFVLQPEVGRKGP